MAGVFQPSWLPRPSAGVREAWVRRKARRAGRSCWGAEGSLVAAMHNEVRAPEREYHVPIMAREVLEILQPLPGKQFLDGTLGGGGHSERLLEAGAEVIGLDRDGQARDFACARLTPFSDRFSFVRGSFGEMAELVGDVAPFDGILLDIGVSSAQLDTPERGFSFRLNGKLDMRMDTSSGEDAAQLIATADEGFLSQIFREFGEERHAKRIAKAIVRARAVETITSTGQLAEIIARAVPGKPGKTHPATRCFQALRIAVNAELEQLQQALEAAGDLLKPGGRLAIITFHSLEDRMVKRFFLAKSKAEIDAPNWPAPKPNPELTFQLLTRKAITPSNGELARNPRARSAKLRAVEKL